eukprot:Tbor_TRINITY_DN4549_c0_g1::TRINITY_DN4549_c0_g1_i1::g.15896::m.15896
MSDPAIYPLPENNDYLDTDSDVSDLDPESDVLAPVQMRIEEQLRRNLEELSLNLLDTTNESKMMKQKREDCGAELYNVQQQLAKLQESLEKGHDNFLVIQRLREKKEVEKEQLINQSESADKVLEDMNKKYSKLQSDLDKLSETIKKVEDFNSQIQSEIQIERRAVFKAEDAVSQLEKQKSRQDLLVDKLNERIKSLNEQHAALSSQVTAQKAETKVAKDTLAEALSEMEAISFEKKQLVQQWKTSIIGMQRRDNAVRITEDALNEQKEELLAIDGEISGYRQSIKIAQSENAKLSSILSKIENEVRILEKHIDAMLEKKTKATQKYSMLKSSIDQADADKKVVDAEIRTISAEISSITKKCHKAAKDVNDMEKIVMETLGKQTSLKKESLASLQNIEKLKNSIRDKELHVSQMENELARIRVDTLQTQSHNEVLKQTVGELEKELKSRDSLIEKMQVDIRRKHDEFERKQKQLDSLNKQYESIIAAQGSGDGDHMGPLEAVINSLSKSITQKSLENDLLQREWIKLQTELVNSKNYNSQLGDSIQELKAQCTILTQKRNRLLATTKKEKQDISLLENTAQNMHLELKKLNTLITKNSKSQEVVASDAYLVENDLVKRLKERKHEAFQLEKRIEDIRQAKADLVAKILAAERDIMFWEKKIQIAKETEMAIDPNIGRDEINRMKREIYIMEQRLGNIQREQKRKIETMEKLIEHRDVLRTKGQAIQVSTKSGQKGVTKVTVGKENARVAAEINVKKLEAQEKEKQIKASLFNTENSASEAEILAKECDRVTSELNKLQELIDMRTRERQNVLNVKTRKSRTLQRIRDAKNDQYTLTFAPEVFVEEKRDIEAKKRQLMAIMQELTEHYPQLADPVGELMREL